MDTQRHSRRADVPGGEEQASVSELIDAVRGRTQRLDSLEAAHELGRRRPDRWAQVLGDVVRNKDRPENLRAAAAVELGREKARVNQNALVAALDPGAPAVTRRAAEGLGRIGSASALEHLNALPSMTGPAGSSVEFARTLIAYRLGLDEPRLTPPPTSQVVEVAAEHGVPISVHPVPVADVETQLEQLHPEVPAIALSPEGAITLQCGGEARFLVLFTEQAHRGQALTVLMKGSAVLATVFEWWDALGRYALSEYVLTHPDGDARLRLLGVRASGVLAHTGEIHLDDTTARFTVRGLDRPHSMAVTIDGSIDRSTKDVSFSQALADPSSPGRRPGLRLTEAED